MTAVDDRPTTEIGAARKRKEDRRLITGRTRWTDNIQLPGMLHLAMVRSPFAHARITAIDTSEATSAPGVVAVFTGKDLEDSQGVNINAWPITADQVTPTHLPVVIDHVACAGEIVAVVVARTQRAARDAAEKVDVDYDELPAVLDLKEAAADTVLAHPDLGTNKSAFWKLDSAEAGTGGNVDEAIAKARVDGIVIEREYRQQRLVPAFMEPRSTVVDPTSEQMTVWSATQVPHILRFAIAATMGIPESKVRVIAPDVGGGFGGKLQTTPEEFATIAVARKLGRPCKFTETRSESMISAHHGRDQWQKLTLSAEKDGTVTGFKVELLADMGAYIAIVGGGVPVLGAWMFNSIYKFPAYQFNCQTVLTNKTWVDAYRGAGRPEATYAIERIMDELAAEVGVDPLEIRAKNWITHDEFPFTTVAGMTYDSGNYEAATAKAVELFGYDELRAEQKRRRDSNDPVQLGIGVSTFTEMCGLAPSRVLGSLSYGAGGWEHASIRMLATGTVEVITGTSPHGQGHETAWSQIVADRLGVPFENVEVLHGDTQIAPKGLDTYGSRSLVVGGEALVLAADKVIEKAKPFAAHLLEASADDLEFSGGRFTVKGTDKGHGDHRDRARDLRRAQPPRRRRAEHRRRRHLRPGELLVPPRHAPVRHGGRHRDRRHDDAQVRLRRRHRQDHQPAHRRGPGARRPRAGHRAGAVGGGRVRRPGHPRHGLLRRLHPAHRGRHDQLRHRPHHLAVDDEHPRHQGRGGGRHHRLHPGGRQRDRGCRAAPRRQRRPDAVHARTGVEGDPVGRGALRRRDRAGPAALRGRLPQPGPSSRRDGRSSTVIPAAFDYLAPTTVDEALAALAAGGDDAKVMGGGQSLLPILRMRLNAPDTLVDLGRIEALRGIRDAGDHLVIGAMTPYSDLLESDLVHEHAALLAKAVAEVADPQIRHRGTIGGALVHADPAGDVGAPVLALDAELVIVGAGGERTVPAGEFFRDLFETSVAEGELLTEVRIPKHTGWGSHYEKFVRVSHQWSIVGVAVALKADGGTISEARIGLTNMGSTPLRARGVEQALVGRSAADLGDVCAQVADGTNPPSDLNGDADYRRHLARVLTRRAVLTALGG